MRKLLTSPAEIQTSDNVDSLGQYTCNQYFSILALERGQSRTAYFGKLPANNRRSPIGLVTSL